MEQQGAAHGTANGFYADVLHELLGQRTLALNDFSGT
jgi:hypothetical protein